MKRSLIMIFLVCFMVMGLQGNTIVDKGTKWINPGDKIVEFPIFEPNSERRELLSIYYDSCFIPEKNSVLKKIVFAKVFVAKEYSWLSCDWHIKERVFSTSEYEFKNGELTIGNIFYGSAKIHIKLLGLKKNKAIKIRVVIETE